VQVAGVVIESIAASAAGGASTVLLLLSPQATRASKNSRVVRMGGILEEVLPVSNCLLPRTTKKTANSGHDRSGHDV
jgi:hypothetical protein